MLTEAIAGALDTFFVIDQQSMETSLLSDAAVKLHNTELRPCHDIAIGSSSNTTFSVRGMVKYVAFEWHWGKSEKDGGSDLVKDVTLTLQGLEFTVSLKTKESNNYDSLEDENTAAASVEGTGEEPVKAAGSLMSYVQNQIERIMDTLTLAVNDVTLKVDLPDGSILEFGGNGVEISSLGRQEGLPLIQELNVQHLHFNAISRDGVSYPLLEEISYKAKSERLFGSRFLSSFGTCLEVMGESNDHGVVIHAGKTQVEVVSKLVGMLSQAPLPSVPIFETTDGVEVDISASVSDDTTEKEGLSEELPSYIQLPLTGVTMILPNESKMALSNIVFKYQMDGTVFSLEGKQGIAVDDHPFFVLGETSIWIADMVKSEFRVEDTAITDENVEEEFVAYFRANSSELAKLSEGVMDFLDIYEKANELEDSTDSPPTTQTRTMGGSEQSSSSSSSSSWTLHVPGMIGCLWEQSGSDIEVSLCHVEAKLETMSMTVTRIDKFQYSGTLHLVEPIEDTTFTYGGSSISIILQDVVVILTENEESDVPIEASKGATNNENSSMYSDESSGTTSGYALPVGMHLSMNKFLAFKHDGKSVHTTLEKLELTMDPANSDSNSEISLTQVAVSVSKLNHDMIRLKEPIFQSTLALLSNYDVISSFHFGAKEINVAAGYSLSDWKALLPKRKVAQIEKKPLKLPNAHVSKLKVIVAVKGIIGVKDSVLQVGSFDGTETTTSEDLINFYGKKVTSQIPNMIVNAEVLGTSVGDGVVSNYGGAMLGNIVGGAGIGGLLSVAAFDGVRNTVKEGKVSRGVEETDDWKFSDIARGLQHAAVRATREGAAKRGKGLDENGNPIDWAVGATGDATKYAGENKGRLAGAGAGALGFGYGFALGGPVGAVVGTIVASAATQKTVETIDDATNTKKGIEKDTVFSVHDVSSSPENDQNTNNEILYSGILLKRRDLVQWDWHSHYFVLTKRCMKYYLLSNKHPKGHKAGTHELFYDSSKGPRKSLDFVNHYIGNDGNLSRPDSSLFVFSIFSLESAQPLWTLAASSEETRAEWLSAVSKAMASENDIQRSKLSLSSSVTKIDKAKRDSLRHSLPPELRDMLDY